MYQLFPFIAEMYSIVRMDYRLFILLFLKHVGGFRCSVILNKAPPTLVRKILRGHLLSFLWDKHLSVQLLGCVVGECFVL